MSDRRVVTDDQARIARAAVVLMDGRTSQARMFTDLLDTREALATTLEHYVRHGLPKRDPLYWSLSGPCEVIAAAPALLAQLRGDPR